MKLFQRFGSNRRRIARAGIALGLTTALLGSAGTIAASSASADSAWAGSSFCTSYANSSYQGSSYAGVAVCSGPNFHGKVSYGGVIFEYGNSHYSSWQCVEYADRYFYAMTGKAVTSMTGKDWVANAHAKYPQYAASAGTSTFDSSIQPGDPISMWGGSGSDPDGHIAIVTSVNVSGGNGTITVIGENQSAPTTTINVSNGRMTRGSSSSPYYYYTAFQWLKLNPPAAPTPSSSLSQYANSIVKQNNGQPTSWWVSSDLKRLWIPDGNTYNQLVARYHPKVYLLSASTLNQLPDQTNQWAASGSTWGANRELRQGMSVSSNNGIYTLVMQGDGNLVLYTNAGRAIWASNTVGRGQFVIFQSDGNLVVYTANGQAVWNSSTGGRGATSFNVQDDGNLVEYGNNGAIWSSGTSQARSVQLKWGNVSGHTGPGDNYSAGPTHAKGTSITILCYVNGSMPVNRNPAAGNDSAWYNDNMWDRATDGYYYSDAWLATGSDGPVVPHC